MQNDRLDILVGSDLGNEEVWKGAFSHNSVEYRLDRAITERLTILWWHLLFWVRARRAV